MNRTDFIKAAMLGIAGISISPSWAFSAGPTGAMPGNWAWADGWEDGPDSYWEAFFEKLLKGGIGGLLVHGSNRLYEKIGPAGKRAGMQIHTWRWTINRGDFMDSHPEWYSVNRLGQSVTDHPPYVNYYRWLCPSWPEVGDALAKDYAALAQIPGIRGVHLDYVRYCDQYLPVGLLPKYNLVQDHEMPEYDYCYCPKCRDTFRHKHGYDPLDKSDPSSDESWRQFRLDQLVNTVLKIVDAVHQTGSVITGAVFPTPEMSRRMVRQDWPRFRLDAYMPMLYHEFYLEPATWIGKCIREARAEVPSKTPIYAGIMINPTVFNRKILAQTYREVMDAGGNGLAVFQGGGMTSEQLRTLGNLSS